MAVYGWSFGGTQVVAVVNPILCSRSKRPRPSPNSSGSKLTPHGNKLPPTVHAVLPWDRQVKGRTIIVGDVHGCFDELQELLSACYFRPKHDNLVLVGDIVYKGPKSLEVLRLAIKTGAYAVRGNHDDRALHAINNPASDNRKRSSWVEHVRPEEVKFLEAMPFSLRLEGRGVLVVHAGLIPGRTLVSQRLVDLCCIRLCRPRGKGQEKVPWASIWKGPMHVFFGHDAEGGLQLHAAATGLDTGCCYGKQLTACILPALSPPQGPLEQEPSDGEGPCWDDDPFTRGASSGLLLTPNELAFANARQLDKAVRESLQLSRRAGLKAQKSMPQGKPVQAPESTLLTLAQLQGKLVSVPAKLEYCTLKGNAPAALAEAEQLSSHVSFTGQT